MTEYYKNLIPLAIIYYIVLLVSRLVYAVLADTGTRTSPIPLTLCPFERYCAAGLAKRRRAAAASNKKNYTKTEICRQGRVKSDLAGGRACR